MQRRAFLKTSALGIGAATFASAPFDLIAKDKGLTKLTVLHTNDMHSWIEPYTKGKYKGLGGMAQRSALIKKIREEEDHVLLLDAGDIFQGTPYFNFFGGELEFKLMSRMGYDAATIGNHDFDNGIEGLNNMLPHAEFPFINCNYDFSQTILKGKTIPYKIFKKGSIKIGVFGVGVELEGLVSPALSGDTKWNDPIETARYMAKKLKEEEKCHLVICLSHLGFEYQIDKVSDRVLGQNVDNLDFIIGGHTHTFLEKPVVEKSPSGKEVLINQVGWAGINLGRIDFYFGNQQTMKTIHSSAINIVDNLLKG